MEEGEEDAAQVALVPRPPDAPAEDNKESGGDGGAEGDSPGAGPGLDDGEEAHVHTTPPPAAPATPPKRPRGREEKKPTSPAKSPVSARGGEYGKMVAGCAVFEPDELFLVACRNKGIPDPGEVFRAKTLKDFTDGGGEGGELQETVAARRLESYDQLRARMMAIVLTERERLVREIAAATAAADGMSDAASTATPSQAHTPAPPPDAALRGGPRPHTVPSLRPPRGFRHPEQVDALASLTQRLEKSKRRAQYDQRSRAFLRQRTEEEIRRQDAAHKELKIRHILSDVQRREIAKVNERILAGRHKRAETARLVRETIRGTWEGHSQGRLQEMTEKAEQQETQLEKLQEDRSHWLAERARQREAKQARARQLREQADNDRLERLDHKVDIRQRATQRKDDLDRERVQSLRERRCLEDAYRQQVVGISEKLHELKEHTVLSHYEKKVARSDAPAREDTVGRPTGHTKASIMKRSKIVRQKEAAAAAAQHEMEERLASKDASMAAAEESRHRMHVMRSENIKLACERKQAMALRTQREHAEHQRQLMSSIQDKHRRCAERMQIASDLKRAIAEQQAAL